MADRHWPTPYNSISENSSPQLPVNVDDSHILTRQATRHLQQDQHKDSGFEDQIATPLEPEDSPDMPRKKRDEAALLPLVPKSRHILAQKARNQSNIDFHNNALLYNPQPPPPPTIRTVTVEPPHVALMRATIARFVYPGPYGDPEHDFILTGLDYRDSPRVMPHLPPFSMPNHPVFAFYGRNLSSPELELPRLLDHSASAWYGKGRNLFVLVGSLEDVDGGKDAGTQGKDMSDCGFGPGVRVHADVKGRVEAAVAQMLTSVMQADAAKGGYLGK